LAIQVEMPCEVDSAHSTFAQEALDSVVADHLADQISHRPSSIPGDRLRRISIEPPTAPERVSAKWERFNRHAAQDVLVLSRDVTLSIRIYLSSRSRKHPHVVGVYAGLRKS
jgi:hypothetical protein